jgi:uncharacterized membrane protein
MRKYSPIPAVIAYLIPIVGWLYVYVFQRSNALALYHLRQSIGLVVFLLGVLLGWIVVGWLLAWIPYMAVFSVALFAIVIAAWIFGVFAWLMGMLNAAKNMAAPLPLFGQWASRLPIA